MTSGNRNAFGKVGTSGAPPRANHRRADPKLFLALGGSCEPFGVTQGALSLGAPRTLSVSPRWCGLPPLVLIHPRRSTVNLTTGGDPHHLGGKWAVRSDSSGCWSNFVDPFHPFNANGLPNSSIAPHVLPFPVTRLKRWDVRGNQSRRKQLQQTSQSRTAVWSRPTACLPARQRGGSDHRHRSPSTRSTPGGRSPLRPCRSARAARFVRAPGRAPRSPAPPRRRRHR